MKLTLLQHLSSSTQAGNVNDLPLVLNTCKDTLNLVDHNGTVIFELFFPGRILNEVKVPLHRQETTQEKRIHDYLDLGSLESSPIKEPETTWKKSRRNSMMEDLNMKLQTYTLDHGLDTDNLSTYIEALNNKSETSSRLLQFFMDHQEQEKHISPTSKESSTWLQASPTRGSMDTMERTTSSLTTFMDGYLSTTY